MMNTMQQSQSYNYVIEGKPSGDLSVNITDEKLYLEAIKEAFIKYFS